MRQRVKRLVLVGKEVYNIKRKKKKNKRHTHIKSNKIIKPRQILEEEKREIISRLWSNERSECDKERTGEFAK